MIAWTDSYKRRREREREREKETKEKRKDENGLIEHRRKKNTDQDAMCKMATRREGEGKNGAVTCTRARATYQLLEIKLGIIGFLLLSLLLNDRLELILILLSS